MQLVEREITIHAPWGKLRGLTWGAEADPPVLLCHGRMDACTGFRPLLKLLPKCFYYVSVDLPGNGKSDHLPRGVQLTAMDFVPTVKAVREHFKWDKFIYVGHSLGALLGKLYNIAYPGHITRTVELDPLPAHECFSTDLEGVRRWYHKHYHSYYEQYGKLNGDREAPKYTYEKALAMVMKARSLQKEAAEHVIERVITPAGDGLFRSMHSAITLGQCYLEDWRPIDSQVANALGQCVDAALNHSRFNHDQRQKTFTRLPFSGEICRAIYTSIPTPTFCVLAKGSVDAGGYDETPFVKDPGCWPNGNYSVKIVEGGHDVHISHPERLADDVGKFLMTGVRAKM